MRLENKVAVITGAGSGIGSAIAKNFIAEGAAVALLDVNLAAAEALTGELGDRAAAFEADVTNLDQLEAAANAASSHFGGIDALINNAGIRIVKSFENHTEEDWRRILDVNLTGQFLTAKAVVPHMISRGKGKMVNVASIAGIGGRPNRVAYVAAKFGIVGMTRALAMDLSPHNICVNALCPSMIASPLNISLAEDGDIGPQWAKDNLSGRWGQPEDVAKVAVFLASDDADYVTGSEYRVDGGEATGLIRAGEMDPV
ncbi:MAG: short-chain dehydrogenase [Alphaproteobacteria bacterium]|nr:short-chain dehydrogenase [Alphaproteobacteria bacterium]